ncbi:hypothetical protein [Melaminivora sp.]|uniref:hypothetical protein n=1 Tax=Melaminivora sp. TaxID=1933032 RepID=UPI0028AFA8BA|nr:hypothetical protein [Melaminivora sp.]
MAGWMTALKFVPWGQVLEATPKIVQSARRLIRREEQGPAPATPAAASVARSSPLASDAELLQGQLTALQEQMGRLQEDQRASAVLIRSLAEQNAQLVRAIDALRARSRWLMGSSALLAVVSLGLLGWVLGH